MRDAASSITPRLLRQTPRDQKIKFNRQTNIHRSESLYQDNHLPKLCPYAPNHEDITQKKAALRIEMLALIRWSKRYLQVFHGHKKVDCL